MPEDMGLGVIGQRNLVFRRKFRWMFTISDVVGKKLPMLPPAKAARPSISIKEMEVRHLDEVVYYPGRQDWKTINLTLYHVQCQNNPVFDWLKALYNPQDKTDPFKYGITVDDPATKNFDESTLPQFIKRNASCVLYDGCGEIMETWTYDCVWPTSIDWGELDFESSDLVYVDVTLRYARAYVT